MEQIKNAAGFPGEIGEDKISLYHLKNANGVTVSITNLGATITGIVTPDKNGISADIVLGYDRPEDYADDEFYIGSIVGRFANRIAGGLVELDGKPYQLTVKDGGYHHHGGKSGFNKKVWQAGYFDNNGAPTVKMRYLSCDGEEGFPGDMLVQVIYTLNNHNQLVIDITATTNKTTLINITQHTYFNLSDGGVGDILGHTLLMPLSRYLPVNELQVPTGELADVTGTPFDFRSGKTIGLNINDDDGQLRLGRGYDHSWVIKTSDSADLQLAGTLTHESNGRFVKVYTTEPAVHLYSGNFLDDVKGKNNAVYQPRSGVCLETQHYPDAPNNPHFPGTVLREGDVFESKTIFEFGIAK